MESIAVIDFETTGVSPTQARATEIGVAIIEDGRIVDRYQSLMNSGAWVPPFIEQLTGISNAMLRKAPPSDQVMNEVADFIGERPLLAHNASFDQKFWDAELARVRRRRAQPFACSLLLSRRLLALGLKDSFRLFEQPEKSFSWWDYRMLGFQKNQGLRIDHVLLSDALAARCSAAGIDREMRKRERPSDHAPVWAQCGG